MPVDTSIYGQIKGPPQIDIGALINTARAAQQLQGESALGDIYKQAIDPTTGEVNAGKLGTLAPSAGVLAPQIAQQSQTLAQGQQAIDRNKLDNIREWWKTLDAELYAHMNDPDLNHKKVLDSVHGLIGHKNSELNGGIFTPQLATQATAWLWGPDGQPLPPGQIRQRLAQFHQRVQGNLASSEYVPIGVNPETGEQLYMTRNGAIARDAALPRGGAGTGAPAAPGAARLGSAPAAIMPRGAAAPPASTPGVVMQPGGVPAMPFSLPLGGAESAQEMRADLSRQGQFSQDIYPWQEALSAARKLGGNLRPGSRGWQEFQSYFYGVAPQIAQTLGVDPRELADYTKADKYLTQAAQLRSAGLGGHTDQQLATSIRATPNVGMNDLAADELIVANMALRRAEYAQVQQSAQFGGPAYTGKKAEWASQNDIRAYTLDLLSPEALAKLLGSLKEGTPQYERFHRSLQAAYDTGVMDRPAPTAPGRAAASAPPAPAARVSPTAGVPANYHDVQPGETLVDIARGRRLTVDQIAATDPYIGPLVQRDPSYATARLPPGYRVALPSGPAAPSAAPIVPRSVATVPAAPAAAVPSPHIGGLPAIPGYAAGRDAFTNRWAGGGTPDMAGASAAQPGRSASPAPWPSSAPAAPAAPVAATRGIVPAPEANPAPTPLPTPPVHEVARGQTLGQVARKYGVSADDIARANGLSPDAPIRAGMRLTIPVPLQPPVPGARRGRRPDGSPAWYVMQGDVPHEVVPGR